LSFFFLGILLNFNLFTVGASDKRVFGPDLVGNSKLIQGLRTGFNICFLVGSAGFGKFEFLREDASWKAFEITL
jgi:hypothetical protein